MVQPVPSMSRGRQPGWELFFPAAESPREVVIRELKDDGFDGTPLDGILRMQGVGVVSAWSG